MKMMFQEIRIIATGPCIANQLRDVNTICRISWYIAAHMLSNSRYKSKNDADEAVYVVSLTSNSGGYINGRN